MGKIKCNKYISILLIIVSCGFGFTKGVINGETAARLKFPSTVYFVVTTFQNFTNFSNYWPHCTGNIVDENWILSAAHCFDNKIENDLQVFAGVYDRSQEESAVQRREIDAIVFHPKRNRNMFHNDLALVHVKYPFAFDAVINKTVLPDKQFKTSPTGLMVFAGWGWTKKSNDITSFPNKLQQGILGVVPEDKCEEEYKIETEEHKNFSAALCGLPFNENTSLCSGDSGGGAFCWDGSRIILCGTFSYNVDCDRSPPSVFTFLSEDTVAWIKKATKVVKTPQNDDMPLKKSSEPKIKVENRITIVFVADCIYYFLLSLFLLYMIFNFLTVHFQIIRYFIRGRIHKNVK